MEEIIEKKETREINPDSETVKGWVRMLQHKQLRRQNDPNDVTLELIDSIIFRYEDEIEGWDELNISQQATLKTAIEESNQLHNLVPHEDVLKMMDKMIIK